MSVFLSGIKLSRCDLRTRSPRDAATALRPAIHPGRSFIDQRPGSNLSLWIPFFMQQILKLSSPSPHGLVFLLCSMMCRLSDPKENVAFYLMSQSSKKLQEEGKWPDLDYMTSHLVCLCCLFWSISIRRSVYLCYFKRLHAFFSQHCTHLFHI